MLSRLRAAFRWLYTFDRLGCQVRLSARQKLPLIALPLLVLWYLARPAPVAAAAAVGLGSLLLFSYLWARSLARGVEAGRRLRYAAVQVGDELEEQVAIHNASALPLVWVELIDQSDLPDYPFSSVRSLGGNSHTEWRTHTTCTRRGVFTLGPWQTRCGDPFGLFLVTHTYLQKNDVLVYPPLAPLPPRLLPRGQVQGEERPLHQPLRAETQDAFTARPYQPGDPLRHLHWPITARHDAPYVKVFEPEDASTVWLLADLDAAAHVGVLSDPDSSLETMILLLASLTSELLRQRVAVGLLAFSGDPTPNPSPVSGRNWGGVGGGVGVSEPQVCMPSRNPLHLWDILRTLALLEPSPHPFQEALDKARALVGGRDQVLAVTPSLSAAWLPALHQLNRGKRMLSASVILIDPASFEIPTVETQDFASRSGDTHPDRATGAGDIASRGLRVETQDIASQSRRPTRAPAETQHLMPPAFGGASLQRGSAGQADTFASLLARQGVHCSVVRRGELRPIHGAYGELSRWEFKTLGTGRVVVRHAPRPAGGMQPSDDKEAA